LYVPLSPSPVVFFKSPDAILKEAEVQNENCIYAHLKMMYKGDLIL
jgi:hypothetical protein